MVKERADGSPQLNLRVPMEHHERVRRMVALLRSAEGFHARLDDLIATASEPLTPSFQADIMARLERLEAKVFAQAKPAAAPAARAARTAIKIAPANAIAASGDRKKGAALTDEQWAKIRHLLETTKMSNPKIAAAVGTNKETVRRMRLQLREDVPL